MKQWSRQTWIFWGIAGGIIILLIWLITPTLSQVNYGSTYGKSPGGYSAWYELMEQRKTPIQRWKQKFDAFAKQSKGHPIVFLRIYSDLREFSLTEQERNWIRKGNLLVILGRKSTVTEASFSTKHKTSQGTIKIETTRRNQQNNSSIVDDQFGGIVWEENIGNGQIIYSTTPYLAANVYQDTLSNHEFLANLIESYNPQKIWVDEYLHGYRKQATEQVEQQQPEENDEQKEPEKETEQQQKGSLLVYLSQTPFLLLLVQVLIIALIALWSNNLQWKKRLTLASSRTDNTQAYIDALASLLQKAKSGDFIIDTVGKEEQLKLQKELGIKTNKLDDQGLMEAWRQQTEQPITKLRQLLRIKSQKRSFSNLQLLTWMQQWQAIQKEISKKDS